MFDLLLRWNTYYKWSSLARKEKTALKVLHSFTDSVIAQRKAELLTQSKLPVDQTDFDYGIKEKKNLIDLLLQTTCNGDRLSDREIREEVDTFMFEGHDTTTSAIAFAIYMMAKNKSAQDKVYEELLQVFGSDGDVKVTTNTLNCLSYMELCIKGFYPHLIRIF